MAVHQETLNRFICCTSGQFFYQIGEMYIDQVWNILISLRPSLIVVILRHLRVVSQGFNSIAELYSLCECIICFGFFICNSLISSRASNIEQLIFIVRLSNSCSCRAFRVLEISCLELASYSVLC